MLKFIKSNLLEDFNIVVYYYAIEIEKNKITVIERNCILNTLLHVEKQNS